MPSGKFFRMKKGDALFLGALIAVSAAAFLLPGLRTGKALGVAYYGWWMAAFMFFAPVFALWGLLKK